MENQCFICRQALHPTDDWKICKICSIKVHKECTSLTPPDTDMRLALRYCNRCLWIVDNSHRDENLENMYRTLPAVIETNETPTEIISEQYAFLEYYSNPSNRHFRHHPEIPKKAKEIENNENYNLGSSDDELQNVSIVESIKNYHKDEVEEVYNGMIKNSEESCNLEPPEFGKINSFENSDEYKLSIEESLKSHSLETMRRQKEQERIEEEKKKEYERMRLEEIWMNNERERLEKIKMEDERIKYENELRENEKQENEKKNFQDLKSSQQKITPPKLLKKRETNTNKSPENYINSDNIQWNPIRNSEVFKPGTFSQPPPSFQPCPVPEQVSLFYPSNMFNTPTGPIGEQGYMIPNNPGYSYEDITQSRVYYNNPMPVYNYPTFSYEDIEQDRVPITVASQRTNEVPEPTMRPPPDSTRNPSSSNPHDSELLPGYSILNPAPISNPSLISSNYSILPDLQNNNSNRISVYQELKLIKEDPRNHFDLLKKIGNGSIGQVFLSKEKSTNKEFAIKILKPSSETEKRLILNEVTLTVNSQNNNIIIYHKFYEHFQEIWIIEELMACSLADLILDRPGRIPESIIAYLLREILKGLAYLHRRQRIHRDLKSDNILLSMEGQVKIGDLGYCVQLSDQNPNRQTFAGTLLWMAPEVVNQDFYNEKVDIWSLGIITFELVTGEPPHYKDGQQKIVISILNHNAPSIDRNNFNISDELFSFVSRCLVKDPMGRADCEELLFHPFIQNLPCTCDEFRGFFEEWKLNR